MRLRIKICGKKLKNTDFDMFHADSFKFLKQFNSNALDAMKSIQWTGNIRELRNMIERLVILAGDKITLEDVKLYANVK